MPAGEDGRAAGGRWRARVRRRRRPRARSVSPSTTRTIWATWAFSARPWPATASFTRAGAYSCTSRPARAHTSSATPRACPSLAAACGVLGEEERLDAGLGRPVHAHHLDERALDDDEPHRDGRRLVGVRDAVRDVDEPRAAPLDDAPAEVARARIEPEHDRHPAQLALSRFASSSSEMSKSA